jgi:hypothetical protein
VATSKVEVAALGDAAPGGGVFAGPGFVGWPTAAGNGWIAFRGQTSFSTPRNHARGAGGSYCTTQAPSATPQIVKS